jgi:predicted nucleic acid-binding protein
VAALVDTNVLVSRFDPRFPSKQATATEWLRRGIAEDSARIAHQSLVEFVAAVTRAPGGAAPLLAQSDAIHEAEEMLAQFKVLFPTPAVFRLALRGMATYQLGWFDAHLWAYAEHFGMSELWSEDFQDGRLYGSVRAVNPFTGGPDPRSPGRPAP